MLFDVTRCEPLQLNDVAASAVTGQGHVIPSCHLIIACWRKCINIFGKIWYFGFLLRLYFAEEKVLMCWQIAKRSFPGASHAVLLFQACDKPAGERHRQQQRQRKQQHRKPGLKRAPFVSSLSLIDLVKAPNEEMMNGNHTEEEKRNKKNKTKTKRNENEKLEEISEFLRNRDANQAMTFFLLPDSIFEPREADTGDMSATDREIEQFKQFCLDSKYDHWALQVLT